MSASMPSSWRHDGVTADHGPAVSGALRTPVTARAGKDLGASFRCGLLAIGPRFGGALGDAAPRFTAAHDAGTSLMDFIDGIEKRNQLVLGIGRRINAQAFAPRGARHIQGDASSGLTLRDSWPRQASGYDVKGRLLEFEDFHLAVLVTCRATTVAGPCR